MARGARRKDGMKTALDVFFVILGAFLAGAGGGLVAALCFAAVGALLGAFAGAAWWGFRLVSGL